MSNNLFSSDDISDIFDISSIHPNECGLLSPHLKENLKNRNAIELPISPPSSDRVFSVLHSKYHGALLKLVSRRQSISRVSKFSSLRRRQSIGISKMLNDTLTIASTPLKLNVKNAEKLIPSLSTVKRKSICTKRSRLPIKQCLINKKSSKPIKDIFASQFDMINGQEESSYKSLVQASPICKRSQSNFVEVHLMDSDNHEDMVSNYTSKTTNSTVNLIASAILDQRSNNRLSLGTRNGSSSIDCNRSRPIDVDVSSSSSSSATSSISAQGKLTKKSFNFGSPSHHQSANKLRLSTSTMSLLSPKLMKSPRPSIPAIISNQDLYNSSQSSSPIASSLQDFKLQPKSQPSSIVKPCSSALSELPPSIPSSSSRLDHLLRISTMDGMSDLHDTTKAPDTPILLSVDKMKALIGSSMRKNITPFKYEYIPAVFSPKSSVPFISRPTTPKTAGSQGGFDFGLGFSNSKTIKTTLPLTSKESFKKEQYPPVIHDDDLSLSSELQGSATRFSVVEHNNDSLEVPPTLTKKLFVSDGIYSPQRNDQVLDISQRNDEVLDISQQSDEFYSPRPYATEDTGHISDHSDDDDDEDMYADLINSSVYLSGPNIDDSLSEDLFFHETSTVSPKVQQLLSMMTAGLQLIVHDATSPTLSNGNSSSSDEKALKSNGFQRYMKGTPVALRVRCKEETEVEVGADDDNDDNDAVVVVPVEVVAEASKVKETNIILSSSKVLKSPTLKSVSVSNLIRRFQMAKQNNDPTPLHHHHVAAAAIGKEEIIPPSITASSTVDRTVSLRDKSTLQSATQSSKGDQSVLISSPPAKQQALKEEPSLHLKNNASYSGNNNIIIDPHGSAAAGGGGGGNPTPNNSVLTYPLSLLPTKERTTRSTKVRFVGVPLTPQSCQDSMKKQNSRDRGVESPNDNRSAVDIITPVKGQLTNGKPVSITRTRSSVRLQRRGMMIQDATTINDDDHEDIKENVVDGCLNFISSPTASMTGTPLAESKLSVSKNNNRRRGSINPDDTPFTKSIKCLINDVNISIKGGINVHELNSSKSMHGEDDHGGDSTGMNKLVAATPQIKARRLDRKKHIDELVGTCNDLIHMIDASI